MMIQKKTLLSLLVLSLVINPLFAESRNLKRRVQLKKIVAPPIQIPQEAGGGNFDFAFVANAQMADILNRTESFSTATVNPDEIYDPSGLSQEDAGDFNRCMDDEEESNAYYTDFQQKITFSQKAACLIEMPQAVISGMIFDFRLISSNGINLSLFQPSVGASFQIDKFELAMEMMAKAPLEQGNQPLSVVQKQAFGKGQKIGLGVSFKGIGIGFSTYSRTPLRKVVDSAFTSAVKSLRDNWQEPWFTMVLRNCDKTIYINGGNKSDVGLMVGDIVKVVNVTYGWAGPVCRSALNYELADKVVAYAVVERVGRNISVARIIENDPNYPQLRDPIQPGSRVYMHQMITPPEPPKKDKKPPVTPPKSGRA